MDGKRFGLSTLYVAAGGSAPRFSVAAAAPSVGEVEPPSREVAAHAFVEDLFRRGKIDMGGHGDPDQRVAQPHIRKTHELVVSDSGVKLQRRTFDCGFDAGVGRA